METLFIIATVTCIALLNIVAFSMLQDRRIDHELTTYFKKNLPIVWLRKVFSNRFATTTTSIVMLLCFT